MNTARRRLVHLTTTDISLEWLLAPQLAAFQAAGYEVIAMSSPGPHVAAIEAIGVRHVGIPSLSRAGSLPNDWRAVRELRHALRAESVDILHTHNPKTGVLGRIIGRSLRIPVIVNTQHGLYAQRSDRRRKRWPVYTLERIAAACSDAELVQSGEDAETLVQRLKVPAAKVSVLGNGIDLGRFDPAAVDPQRRMELRREWGIDDELVVLVVGRLVLEKGLAEVEQLAASLHGHTAVRFVVVGPTDAVKADAVDEGLLARAKANGVHFAGQRSDMPECYAAADIFLTASHREGFPRAAMEAGAMGLPIIATDIRGCREVVVHGHNGILAPVRNPSALFGGLMLLVDDPLRRTQIAARARPYACAHFDQQKVIDITLATYLRLLDDEQG